MSPYKLKTIEDVRARVKELRGKRDEYLAHFNDSGVSEVTIKNYEHINTRLDELSRLIIFMGVEA